MAEETKEEVGPEAPAVATEEAQTEVPSITANDLATMVNIIDAGSQRGAWKGEELSVIGALRNKLVAVVKAVAPQKIEEPTDESTEESKNNDTNAA